MLNAIYIKIETKHITLLKGIFNRHPVAHIRNPGIMILKVFPNGTKHVQFLNKARDNGNDMSVKNIIHSCHFKNTAVSVFPSNRNDRQHNSIMITAVNAMLIFAECASCYSLKFCCLIILLDIFFPRFFFSAYNMHDFEEKVVFCEEILH